MQLCRPTTTFGNRWCPHTPTHTTSHRTSQRRELQHSVWHEQRDAVDDYAIPRHHNLRRVRPKVVAPDCNGAATSNGHKAVAVLKHIADVVSGCPRQQRCGCARNVRDSRRTKGGLERRNVGRLARNSHLTTMIAMTTTSATKRKRHKKHNTSDKRPLIWPATFGQQQNQRSQGNNHRRRTCSDHAQSSPHFK